MSKKLEQAMDAVVEAVAELEDRRHYLKQGEKFIQTRFSADLWKRLKSRAALEDMPVKDLLMKAAEQYLARHK